MSGDWSSDVCSSDLLEWIGCCNELNAAYAADGYARVNGMSALCITHGVGELSAINGVAGAYAERVPMIVITGCPTSQASKTHALMHHTLGDGVYENFREIFAKVTCAQETLEMRFAKQQIDSILHRCFIEKRPVYIELPADLAKKEIEIEGDLLPSLKMPTSNGAIMKSFIAHLNHLLASSKGEMVIADYEINR